MPTICVKSLPQCSQVMAAPIPQPAAWLGYTVIWLHPLPGRVCQSLTFPSQTAGLTGCCTGGFQASCPSLCPLLAVFPHVQRGKIPVRTSAYPAHPAFGPDLAKHRVSAFAFHRRTSITRSMPCKCSISAIVGDASRYAAGLV